MKSLASRIVTAACLAVLPFTALAEGRFSTANHGEAIVIRVDVSEQEMVVTKGGHRLYTWDVSTAARGYVTPTGTYQPEWFSRNHRSSIYGNAPMPFAIFYDGNYAIHATTSEYALGRPASHGCVRLSYANAQTLYELVYNHGAEGTWVVVED